MYIILKDYEWDMKHFVDYVEYYLYKKQRSSLFERFVALSLGAIARSEKTYDDYLKELDSLIDKTPKRSAEDIKSDFLDKFSKGE